jgi:hypothetical protein
MIARGLIVQFPSDAQQQTRSQAEPRFDSYKAKDLSAWLWSSIDHDDSKDLDRIEYALCETSGTRIYIGIADGQSSTHSDVRQQREHNSPTTPIAASVPTTLIKSAAHTEQKAGAQK